MEKKEKRYGFLIVNVLGIFFLFLGFMAVFNSLLIKNPSHVLWMCYISLILIGIGIVMRKSFLVMSQVYILAIPLLVWDVDFLYYLITQKTLLGLTSYFFVDAAWNLGKIISLQHLYTLPVSLYAIYLIGLKRKDAWKLSFVQISLVFVFVSFLTSKEENINCVFEPCIKINLGLPYHLTWFLIFLGMVYISALVLNYFFFRIKNIKNSK